jgi:hypothetical protein
MSNENQKDNQNDLNKELNALEQKSKDYINKMKYLDPYFEYSTLYFTLPDWMQSRNITLKQIFEHTLIELMNNFFIDNGVRLRIFLDRVESYRRDKYKHLTFRYLIRPDINSTYKIGFKILVHVQRSFYPNYDQSLSITITLHSIINYKTGEEIIDIPRNYQTIVKQICNNDESKCMRLFKRIYEYIEAFTEIIITLLDLESYKTYA